MASTRAPAVAEVLWELKRADKVATFSAIANRAGFTAGVNGRAMLTCLKTVQKEWPHLDWWRAIRDDGTVDKKDEQASALSAWGATLATDIDKDGRVAVHVDESRMMIWEVENSATKNLAVVKSPAAE